MKQVYWKSKYSSYNTRMALSYESYDQSYFIHLSSVWEKGFQKNHALLESITL